MKRSRKLIKNGMSVILSLLLLVVSLPIAVGAQKYCDELEHSYASEVTAPTYTELGYTTYTCSVCGDSYKSDYTVPLTKENGDVNGDGLVNATDLTLLMRMVAGVKIDS